MDFNHQAPLSMGFPRQEWSGLPFPSPGDFPDPGMKPWSPVLAGRFFSTVLPRKPLSLISRICHVLESNSLGVRCIEKVSSNYIYICICVYIYTHQYFIYDLHTSVLSKLS